MISYIKGVVIGRGDNYIVVEANGLGYKVFTTPNIIAADMLSIELHTYLQVREDALSLYGFQSLSDLTFFEQLITVSGVGPRMALTVLSSQSTELIKKAIVAQDSALITKVGGVGKKTAEKIILELKGKILADGEILPAGSSDDLFQALENLGYSGREIKEIIVKLDPALPVEERVRQALKLLGK